ncbi:MAG: hypothetical protein FAF04_06280 [Epsilonproteobacteria bacterium]|nr:hypothetical protein [Campylobacterota bacterium]
MADLVAKIEKLEAAGVGIDIIFPEKDRTSPTEIARFYKQFFAIEDFMQQIPAPLRDNDALFSNVLQQTATTMGVYLSNNPLSQKECSAISFVPIDTEQLELKKYQYALCNVNTLHSSAKYEGYVNSSVDARWCIASCCTI